MAKVLMMNTAKILTNSEGEAFSPRQQGAGMINVFAAIETPAVLLDSTANEPKVELKNIPDTAFDLNLRLVNSSSEQICKSGNCRVVFRNYAVERTSKKRGKNGIPSVG